LSDVLKAIKVIQYIMEKTQKVSSFRCDADLSEIYRNIDMIQPTTVSVVMWILTNQLKCFKTRAKYTNISQTSSSSIIGKICWSSYSFTVKENAFLPHRYHIALNQKLFLFLRH